LHGDREQIGFEAGGVSPAQEIAEARVHSQFATMRSEAEGHAHRQSKQKIGNEIDHEFCKFQIFN
jgi:hypothetical protein